MAWIDVAASLVIVVLAALLSPHIAWWFVGLAIFVAAFPAWITARRSRSFRLRREERRLHEKFEDEYDRYRATTWM